MSVIIDGKAIAAEVRAEVRAEVTAFCSELGYVPGLATVLVGDDPASATYVHGKRKASAEGGIASLPHDLPATSSQGQLLRVVDSLNARSDVHGILVQLPLPAHIDANAIIEA